MKDIPAIADQFLQTRWLSRIGEPDGGAQVMGSLLAIVTMLYKNPEKFFAPTRAAPYESMCAEDHEAAARLETAAREKALRSAAKKAYVGAWAHLPDPDVCGLVADDAWTIMALLVAGEPLRPFARERMEWYQAGRVPWGYVGDYPNGRWRIL